MSLNNGGSKFGQSVKESLIAGVLVTTEVNKDLPPNFETKQEKKTYLIRKIIDKSTEDDYQKFTRLAQKDLSFALHILHYVVHIIIVWGVD